MMKALFVLITFKPNDEDAETKVVQTYLSLISIAKFEKQFYVLLRSVWTAMSNIKDGAVVYDLKLLTIFAKGSILDVYRSSDYASAFSVVIFPLNVFYHWTQTFFPRHCYLILNCHLR